MGMTMTQKILAAAAGLSEVKAGQLLFEYDLSSIEDDLKQAEKDLQKLTDESSKKIDELLARKEKELMEV